MSRTAYDHQDFDLNEQQEAVRNLMTYRDQEWFIAYDLIGAGWNGVTIGDAGRRMRELREEGILESRKRGRFEEYRLVAPHTTSTLPGRCPAPYDASPLSRKSTSATRTSPSSESPPETQQSGMASTPTQRSESESGARLFQPSTTRSTMTRPGKLKKTSWLA
jgi:hypothetical protein